MSSQDKPEIPRELLKAQKLANSLDNAFRIPILGIRVGLDAILGLVPVLGDGITLVLSLRIIQLAKKMGMPKGIIIIMLKNSGLDVLLGFVPIIGDIADVFYKANHKNVRIMEQWWLEQNRSQLQQYTEKQLEQWSRSNSSK